MHELLVIDNQGVGEELRREYRDQRVRVVEMVGNRGYGSAANVGLSLARAPAVLVLNQDIEIQSESLGEMIRVGQESRAALVGPTLVDGKGGAQPPKTGYPSGLPTGYVRMSRGDAADWIPVPWFPAAAMLFMPSGMDLRFDQRLFMYAEDEELCWRAWKEGKPVVVSRRALVLHHGATASRAKWNTAEIEARIHWSRASVALKHRRWRSLFPLMLRAMGSWARATRFRPGRQRKDHS